MARRKKEPEVKTLWEKAKWKGFVNLRLNQEEKMAIKENTLDESECFAALRDMATDGYKVSLSYSISEDVFTVSATGAYQGRPNAGITMSLRHRDVEVACSGLIWCHEQAGKHGEWSERFGGTDVDDW